MGNSRVSDAAVIRVVSACRTFLETLEVKPSQLLTRAEMLCGWWSMLIVRLIRGVFGSVVRGEDTDVSDIDLLVDPTAETTLFDIRPCGTNYRPCSGCRSMSSRRTRCRWSFVTVFWPRRFHYGVPQGWVTIWPT